MSYFVTANRLRDGQIVYLGAEDWVASPEEAAVAASDDERDALLARGRADGATVCGVYAVSFDSLERLSAREALRRAGRGQVLERLGLAAVAASAAESVPTREPAGSPGGPRLAPSF